MAHIYLFGKPGFHAGVAVCLASWVLSSAQAAQPGATEDDYFSQVPVVLTASRLDQPLNEAPGAITVIDRHTIRLSGARTLAEVLRLVPGYLSGGWNGANPLAAYHIPLDDYGTRNLVLIDGRSVYSSSYLGDTQRGMMDVMLEDIERLEVLRGSNSAAYGANAMFGVINIITRHSADTVGGELSVSAGDNGIRDRHARIGWGGQDASYRLSVGEQRDTGYLNAYDDKRFGQANFRADLKPSPSDDIVVGFGVSYLNAEEGYSETDQDNPFHLIRTRDAYVQAEWRRQLSLTDEIKVSMNHMEDEKQDATPYPPLPSITLDFGSLGRRSSFELQRKWGLGNDLRAVVGAGFKDERVRSVPLYARQGWLSFQERRLFGTVEWRVVPQWLLNAGIFAGDQSLTGTYTSPRLMLTWLPSPVHTLRMGVTESVRAPTLFEYAGDVRYYADNKYFESDKLLAQTLGSRGNVRPEELRSHELGYLGRFSEFGLTVDVRAFHERFDGVIMRGWYVRTPALPVSGTKGVEYINREGFHLQGLEYQMRWKPFVKTELWLNQTFSHLKWDESLLENRDERRPPEHATVFAWFQHLPHNLRFTLIHERLGSMTWRDNRDWMSFARRTDVRLAYPFHIGSSKAELAFTLQSVEGKRPFFLTRRNFELPRKAFVNLRMEL